MPANGQNTAPVERFRKRVFSPATLIATVIAGMVLALVLWRAFDIDWSQFWDNARKISPASYLLALASYYASFWFRGWRWRLIAKQAFRHTPSAAGKAGAAAEGPPVKEPKVPGATTLGGIILMGWFANSVAFLRIGDVYRGWALAKESGAGAGESLGTVLAERVQDMFAVLILILVAAVWMASTGADVPVVVVIVAFALVGLIVVMLVVMRFFGLRLAKRLPHRFEKAYGSFQKGTLRSFSPRGLPPQLSLGIVGWLLEIARFYFVARGLGVEISFGVVMLVALANAMLTTIPTPGGFGFVESGIIGLLIFVGLDDTTALSLTIVDRTISCVSVVVFCGLLFAFCHLVRDKRRAVLSPSGSPLGAEGARKAGEGA